MNRRLVSNSILLSGLMPVLAAAPLPAALSPNATLSAKVAELGKRSSWEACIALLDASWPPPARAEEGGEGGRSHPMSGNP
jgi:hypothetical protein